ncbi:hypothetical protein ACFQU1_09965 [Chelatococcus sp. GCM10030263]|uniref:hypothetical protein n=1 Tax=Chelatococcus sp. GCM10030263 TaxID=3273387 RepID=UPI003612B05F
MATAGFVSKIAFLMGGFLVWAAHFLLVYGFNGLACARGFDRTMLLGVGTVPFVVGVATLIALALDALIFAAAVAGHGPGISGEPDGSLRRFWRYVTGAIAVFSFVAVLWDGLPALIIEPCA